MNTKILSSVIFFLIIIVNGCCNNGNDTSGENQTVSQEETWISLFNGKDLSGWRSFHSDSIEGWTVEEGCLTALGQGGDLGGDIISLEMYDNFILEFDWKIAPGGNSGVMFRVLEEGHKTTYETGPEYQLIDDIGFPQELEEWQKTGANYAMHNASDEKILKDIEEFNSSKIVVNSAHVEHWLNGVKVVEYELWTEEWTELKENGKWKGFHDYGMAKSGYLSLQDHGAKTWFKNIRLMKL